MFLHAMLLYNDVYLVCTVREFEAKREAYYKDQYRSHVGYWQALGDTMRQSGDNTARLTGIYTVLCLLVYSCCVCCY
jgi:hypothetical protein